MIPGDGSERVAFALCSPVSSAAIGLKEPSQYLDAAELHAWMVRWHSSCSNLQLRHVAAPIFFFVAASFGSILLLVVQHHPLFNSLFLLLDYSPLLFCTGSLPRAGWVLIIGPQLARPCERTLLRNCPTIHVPRLLRAPFDHVARTYYSACHIIHMALHTLCAIAHNRLLHIDQLPSQCDTTRIPPYHILACTARVLHVY